MRDMEFVITVVYMRARPLDWPRRQQESSRSKASLFKQNIPWFMRESKQSHGKCLIAKQTESFSKKESFFAMSANSTDSNWGAGLVVFHVGSEVVLLADIKFQLNRTSSATGNLSESQSWEINWCSVLDSSQVSGQTNSIPIDTRLDWTKR